MLAGILTVVLIVVGLPRLMFWVGGRRFWNRSYGTEPATCTAGWCARTL